MIDMCNALEELRQEGVQEGIQKSIQVAVRLCKGFTYYQKMKLRIM